MLLLNDLEKAAAGEADQGLFNTEVTESSPELGWKPELLGLKKQRAAGWLPLSTIRGITRNKDY